MKILIITQYFYPEQFQINEIATELVKKGHLVTVLTGLPNYPQGEIYPGYNNKMEEIVDGVNVIRVRNHPRKRGAFHLIWNYISFAIKGNKAVKQLDEDYEIVFAYQLSPVTSIYPAITYKKMYGTPVLTYCLDIWPESARAHVKSDKGLLYLVISLISKKLYQQCDHIAVTSFPFIEYLHNKNGINSEMMSYIPQHADSSYLRMNLASQDNGMADFMYAGNLGQGQSVDVIIRAAAELKDEIFVVHIVGEGSYRPMLEKLTKELGIENKVIFYGNQKRVDMPVFYRKADVLLLTLRGNNFVGNTLPGKLQTYMTCGKPILGAINGAAAEVIKEAGCGRCTSAGDYKGLARLMKDYIQNPNDYKECGKNANLFFSSHFTFIKYMDSIIKLMEEMIK